MTSSKEKNYRARSFRNDVSPFIFRSIYLFDLWLVTSLISYIICYRSTMMNENRKNKTNLFLSNTKKKCNWFQRIFRMKKFNIGFKIGMLDGWQQSYLISSPLQLLLVNKSFQRCFTWNMSNKYPFRIVMNFPFFFFLFFGKLWCWRSNSFYNQLNTCIECDYFHCVVMQDIHQS